jgi:hypothetical protein
MNSTTHLFYQDFVPEIPTRSKRTGPINVSPALTTLRRRGTPDKQRSRHRRRSSIGPRSEDRSGTDGVTPNQKYGGYPVCLSPVQENYSPTSSQSQISPSISPRSQHHASPLPISTIDGPTPVETRSTLVGRSFARSPNCYLAPGET